MAGALPALRPAALRQNIAEIVRNLLLEGRFAPGEEVSDSALAAEFQVSRGPVREALLILAEEGLIVHAHNRGFRVPELKERDIEQIAQTRLPLETLALELAREHTSPSAIKELNRLSASLLEEFRRGGISVCARADLAFHQRIWELSGNQWLSAALRRICIPYFAYVAAFQLGRQDQTAELMEEMHRRYIEYLSGNSQQSAQECVAFHLALEVK